MFTIFAYNFSQLFFDLGRSLPPALVAGLATYLIWILAGYTVLLSRPVKPGNLARILVAAAGALLFNLFITWFYFRARPFVALGFQPIIDLSPWSKSFPSDHAALAWCLAGAAWWQNKKSGRWWWPVALAVLISLGRVLAGVHYLSDVIAGAAIGLASSYIVFQTIAIAKKKQ